MAIKRKDEVHVVTTENIPGFTIKESVGLVWATSVRSLSFMESLSALANGFMGGEVKPLNELINRSRGEILRKLANNAKRIGANGVVQTRLATNTVFGGSGVEILAYGTAVRLKKK